MLSLLRLPCLMMQGVCLLGIAAPAQTSPNVPLISGGAGFLSSTNKGINFVQPVAAPVLALPLGDRLLVESRADLRGLYQQNDAKHSYDGSFTASLEYLQLDYLASSHLSFVAGRFLTPFGAYNERLSALWIRNLQDAPLIFGIGTRTSGSSDGLMVRGNLAGNSRAQLSYLGYFSAEKSSGQLQAGRAAGDRIDIYLPAKRLEIGTSYQRTLRGVHGNNIGAHFWWMPWNGPLQVRSEYAHGPHAQGYWIETAWRLSGLGGPDAMVGRLEPVFRMQQVFRNSPGPGDALPAADTKQADFGFVYHLPREVRLNASYSRAFSTVNGNIWNVSLTYRFLFPLWRGGQ